jgi:hypothetical protein
MGNEAVLEISERVKRVSHRVKNTGNIALYRKGIRMASRIRSVQKELEAERLEEDFMKVLRDLYSRHVPISAVALIVAANASGYESDQWSVDSGSEPATVKAVENPTAPPPAPPQPTIEPAQPEPKTKVIMAPTWPVEVPVVVPANYEEVPGSGHPEENALPEAEPPSVTEAPPGV